MTILTTKVKNTADMVKKECFRDTFHFWHAFGIGSNKYRFTI